MKDMRMSLRFTLLAGSIIFVATLRLDAATDSTGRNRDSSVQAPAQHVRYDTTGIAGKRTISREALQEYYIDKDFAYDREATGQPSLWEMIKEWFHEMMERIFGRGYGSKAWDVLTYILIAAAIALVNIILFRSNLRGLFIKTKSRAGITFDELDENIHELNFPALIAAAEQSADYRRAVRLQYLWLLKRLTDTESITWKINKTNRDYAHEIRDAALRRDFRRLSTIFEYVWYGDTTIDDESYRRTKELFLSVHQSSERHEVQS